MYAAFFPIDPTASTAVRRTILGFPLLMSKEEGAKQPPTLLVVAGADPLIQEGKDFGLLLQSVGIDCAVLQAEGQVHDFVMLEPTRGSATARVVVELAGLKLRRALSIN